MREPNRRKIKNKNELPAEKTKARPNVRRIGHNYERKVVKELKDLGFYEPCLGEYFLPFSEHLIRVGITSINDNGAPTYSQAFRFFREKYRLEGAIYRLNFKWASQVFNIETSTYCFKHELFEKYEEAEIHSLQKMIKIIKNK